MQLDDANERRGEPSWSPDGSKIAYMLVSGSVSNIWRMTDGGDNETQLTHSGDDRQPAWSPDGATILFSSDRVIDGVYQIYSMPEDRDPESNISDSSTSDAWADWSANSDQIVFQRNESGITSLCMMWADGSEQTTVPNTQHALKPNW